MPNPAGLRRRTLEGGPLCIRGQAARFRDNRALWRQQAEGKPGLSAPERKLGGERGRIAIRRQQALGDPSAGLWPRPAPAILDEPE